jgi:hypothetical protein
MGVLHLRGQKGRNGENGDVTDQGIAVVAVSPFALAVKVGEAFASLVSDADAFSDGREVVVGPMWGVVWGKVFVHDWDCSWKIRGCPRGASGSCAWLSVNEAWLLYSVKYNASKSDSIPAVGGRRLREGAMSGRANGFQKLPGVNTYRISTGFSETNGVRVPLTTTRASS